MTKYPKPRRYPRVKTEFSATAKEVRRTMFEGKILSLSEGGAFLATKENLALGSEVILFLTLEIPGRRKPCIAQGKVVSVGREGPWRTQGCGIAFDEPSSSLKRLIRDFVEFKRTGKVAAMGVAEPSKPPKVLGRGQLRG